MEHTKEPWWNHGVIIKANDNIPAQATSEEDARRIVACVNACAGIPTEQLESGEVRSVRDELADIATLEKQRDELLAALKLAGRIIREAGYPVDTSITKAIASAKGGAA